MNAGGILDSAIGALREIPRPARKNAGLRDDAALKIAATFSYGQDAFQYRPKKQRACNPSGGVASTEQHKPILSLTFSLEQSGGSHVLC